MTKITLSKYDFRKINLAQHDWLIKELDKKVNRKHRNSRERKDKKQ